MSDSSVGQTNPRNQLLASETCSLCSGDYPVPVELHHSEEECLARRGEFNWPQWVLGVAKVSSTVKHARKVVEAMGEQYPALLVERDFYRRELEAIYHAATLSDGALFNAVKHSEWRQADVWLPRRDEKGASADA